MERLMTMSEDLPRTPIDFRAMRSDADELLRAAARANAVLAGRPATILGGLSDLLDRALPTEPAAEARVARAIDLEPMLLTHLRARALDPLLAPVAPLAVLAQVFGLNREIFLALLKRDHQVLSGLGGQSRGTPSTDAWARVSEAWDRAAEDDASQLEG